MNNQNTKTANSFSLVAREHAGNWDNLTLAATLPTAPNIGRQPTDDEQRVIEAMQRQSIIIAGTASLNQFATNSVARLVVHNAVTFDQAGGEILRLRDSGRQVRSKDHQAWVDLFTEREMELFGTSALAGLELATQSIMAQATRSLDVPPPPPPAPPAPARRRGLLELIFGD